LYNHKGGIIGRNDPDVDMPTKVYAWPLAFLYKDYQPEFWYWEVVETLRRIAFTGGLVLVWQGSSMQIIVAIVAAIAFIKLYVHYSK
jgi:hypothetical protein